MISEQHPVRAFGGRAKWGEVAGNLALVAGGVVLVGIALAAVPADVVAIRVVVGFTVYATVATLVLAMAIASTRTLPPISAGRVDGEDATVASTWSGEWWYAVALDVGLGALGAALLVIGLAAGGAWAVLGSLVALVGLYFLVRAGLAVAGGRRREALWLTSREIGHDSARGRERAPREQVTRVRRIGDTPHLLVQLGQPPQTRLAPAPWRARPSRLGRGGEIVFDATWTGHDPEVVLAWLREELRLGPDGHPSQQ